MALLLQLDTTTSVCSASLALNGKLLFEKRDDSGTKHTSVLTVFIEQLLAETGNSVTQLDAVALSSGPGSYTGLRIGASVAKGICFAVDKPLIAYSTLQAMADFVIQADQYNEEAVFIPLIDARRLDAFFGVYDSHCRSLVPAGFCTLNQAFFQPFSGTYPNVFLFGNAEKKIDLLLISGFGTVIENVCCLSSNGTRLAAEKYNQKQFENVGVYIPDYLKGFEGNKSKKLNSLLKS